LTALQRLLEEKKVHLRPDFEQWIPVDMEMERDFRNQIFEKAGQRETPMLFVDDEFVGG
jgi:glutaredoxin